MKGSKDENKSTKKRKILLISTKCKQAAETSNQCVLFKNKNYKEGALKSLRHFSRDSNE